MLKFIFILAAVVVSQGAIASQFVSKTINLDNGNKGLILLLLNNDSTYSAFMRVLDLDSNSVICETEKKNYWEMSKGDLVLWSLGKAQVVSCGSSPNCLLISVGKYIPVFGNKKIELTPTKEGNTEPTSNVPLCQ